jgi:ATP-binding cassette subfamily B protein
MRYRWFFLIFILSTLGRYVANSQSNIFIGAAADEIVNPSNEDAFVGIALSVLVTLLGAGIFSAVSTLASENMAQKLEANTREELYYSLLGKSQTFHDRQRVGDIMARATDDVYQINIMMSPGLRLVLDTVLGFLVPILFIASIDPRLLLVPAVFLVSYVVTVRFYLRQLGPVIGKQRVQFGKMNARLEETITGIEVVKASTQEEAEHEKITAEARAFRDYFVKQGRIESRYLPLLLYGVALALVFLHAVSLYESDVLRLGDVVAVMGLMFVLRFPTFASIFTYTILQNGIAGADRLLKVILQETDLGENEAGVQQPIAGQITFENVTFGYEPDKPVLLDVSFTVEAGETVAIVGQTGAGKSSLTELVNRTYDADRGRVLIDGIDVRDWNLTALRSQISKIEQDIFLFSRTIAENIAFGAPGATQEQIEEAAREAQAHDFILSFEDGYQTEIGERGVTLSGGQRQRLALARAFLSDPRILILDDSTSAIDSATEDQIQKAIRRAQQDRTTLLITHRLSQIRWADHILVMEKGRVVASGTHDELLRRSVHYRRIFARYDIELPPLEEE